MGVEIERKFLLKNDIWEGFKKGKITIKQGYLNSDIERTVRVRLFGTTGFITVKGKVNGLSRPEFEYEIPYKDAVTLLTLCEQPIIEKIRYYIHQGDLVWEIDVFEGDNEGLVVAEIELTSETQSFYKPTWLGEEVSDDAKYYNSSLITNPYQMWCVNKNLDGEELVDFGLAKVLKKNGFDLETKYYYQGVDLPHTKRGLYWCKGEDVMNHNQYDEYIYSAPTLKAGIAWINNVDKR